MMLKQWTDGTKDTKSIAACAVTVFLVLMFLYRLSGCVGEGTSRECAWAIASVVLVWLASSTLYLLFDTGRFNGFITAFFVSSSLRILLTCASVAILLKYGDLRRHPLLVWSGVLYFLLLLVDTHFNVKYLLRFDQTKKDFFSDSKNEINISDRQPSRRNNE